MKVSAEISISLLPLAPICAAAFHLLHFQRLKLHKLFITLWEVFPGLSSEETVHEKKKEKKKLSFEGFSVELQPLLCS